MVKCKVLNRPDYELTLTSEEKEALRLLLAKQTTQSIKRCGLDDKQDSIIDDIFEAVNVCN
jgi:hypothetical protein